MKYTSNVSGYATFLRLRVVPHGHFKQAPEATVTTYLPSYSCLHSQLSVPISAMQTFCSN